MANRDIIVVGASLGGVDALRQLVRDLPGDLPAAVFIVLHTSPQAKSMLPQILARSGRLAVVHSRDGEKITRARIYVAPPDQHLLVEEGYVRVVKGPRENRQRPAIDPLFRSAARAYGERVIGAVLTGALDDGAAGLLAIKRRGGIAIVQDPNDAFCPGMPRAALNVVNVDHRVPLEELAPLLGRLTEDSVAPAGTPPEKLEIEADFAQMEGLSMKNLDKLGTPSVFTCPECQGALWELQDGDLLRFRCHVGHAYSVDNLGAAQSQTLETALWAALRSLEENITLSRRLANRARAQRQQYSAERFQERATALDRHAAVIRQLLLESETRTEPSHAQPAQEPARS